jgi:hypothetical protein
MNDHGADEEEEVMPDFGEMVDEHVKLMKAREEGRVVLGAGFFRPIPMAARSYCSCRECEPNTATPEKPCTAVEHAKILKHGYNLALTELLMMVECSPCRQIVREEIFRLNAWQLERIVEKASP